MSYPLYIVLSLAPSIIWLLFYLRKDAHPESNKMVIKIFFYGMLSAVIAAVIEIEISLGLSFLGFKNFSIFSFIFYQFITIALVEELSKFLIVKEKVLSDPEFDEPVDAPLYMIIAALGFAALENLLVLFPGLGPFIFKEALIISAFRFIGATFLHALCSGALGYFLALSILEPKKRIKLIFTGIVFASILHGLFNVFIIEVEKGLATQNRFLLVFSTAGLVLLLAGLALFISFGFRKLKKIASIYLHSSKN